MKKFAFVLACAGLASYVALGYATSTSVSGEVAASCEFTSAPSDITGLDLVEAGGTTDGTTGFTVDCNHSYDIDITSTTSGNMEGAGGAAGETIPMTLEAITGGDPNTITGTGFPYAVNAQSPTVTPRVYTNVTIRANTTGASSNPVIPGTYTGNVTYALTLAN